MRLSWTFLVFTLFFVCTAKRDGFRGRARDKNQQDRIHERGHVRASDDYTDSNGYYSKNVSFETPTTTRPKGDAIVEKFVDTLITSERYLKMIEMMDLRLNHLSTSYHERTNTILRYLTELLQLMKTSNAHMLDSALRSLKEDMERLRSSLGSQVDRWKMRAVEGQEFHGDASLDSRLSFLESNTKNIMSGVESILSTIAEVKNRQYTKSFTKPAETAVTGAIDPISLINEFRRTLHEQKSRRCECKMSSGRFDRTERYPTDCHEIQMQGFNVSGIYKIKPDDMEPFYVLCDLTTAGGGWTVFQNRFDGSQDFYKNWLDYKHGFGNLAGEFWLGLEKLNYLTNQKLYELRVEMETQLGQEAFAGYSVFTVGPEHEGYRISTLGTYYGTAGDSLAYHAGQKYSTYDMDNDEWKEGSCASEHGGAWWYKECDKSNLNGKYSMPSDEHRGQTLYWISFKGPTSPLSKTKMMIRPLPASKPIEFDNTRNLEGTKMRGHEAPKGARPKDVKTYDAGRSPYRYEDPARAEAFFPNYA